MIFAYPQRACIRAGEVLTLHVSTDAPRFRVRFTRCGAAFESIASDDIWYAGKYARAGAASSPWNWPAYRIAIPQTWRTGAYVAMLEAERAPAENACDSRSARALFAVRNPQNAARLLVVLALFTYQAYNVAMVDGTLGRDEGESLYSGARWVTLQRPGGGVGGHPWDEVNRDAYDETSPRQTFAHWDAKGLAWLERHGYAYDICTDLELHESQIDLQRYRAVASFGHHEYWTSEMRDAVETYVAQGGNVAFFGGNTCWFQAEYDAGAQAIRRVGRWAESAEWRFTGVSYAYGGGKWVGPRPPSGYTIRNARHWMYEGLGAADGDHFGFEARLIGYECDGAPPESDLTVLADATIAGWPVADGSGEVSAAARASLGLREPGGKIFSAATVDWPRVLDGGNRLVEGMTHNILRRFLAWTDRF